MKDYIKKRRKEKGMTLADAEAKTGISKRRVSDFEKGADNLTVHEFAALCDKLGLMLLITSKETTINV